MNPRTGSGPKKRLCRMQVAEYTSYRIEVTIPSEHIPLHMERVRWLQQFEQEAQKTFTTEKVSVRESNRGSIHLELWISGPNGFKRIPDLKEEITNFFKTRRLPLNPLSTFTK